MANLPVMICPSILNTDLSNLAEECQKLLLSGADRLHLDVMDGHFVPNLSFGSPLIQSLRRKLGPHPFFDVHLMVSEPAGFVESMALAGADIFTFHYESMKDERSIRKIIDDIKRLQMKAGLAIKPGTSVDVVLPFCDSIDCLLIMTVEPGFGGQKFINKVMSKVRTIRTAFPFLDIELDGGIGPENIGECADAGANIIVSGTAIIRSDDPALTIEMLRSRMLQAIPIVNLKNGHPEDETIIN